MSICLYYLFLIIQVRHLFFCAAKSANVEKEMKQVNIKPSLDVRLSDLKLVLGPELRIVYPLILNFTVSGELELNGQAHPKWIKPKGILTFENGDVNLVATQCSRECIRLAGISQMEASVCPTNP
ncbi:hypothetical protein ERO13_D10G105800v2 [Gossypium hirsutum]|nr:hypothetical protein ERO13_D10G105800v2 [Gossypium hirsutum]